MSPLSPEDAALIGRHAAEAEELRELHPEVLSLARDRQWFRLLVPERFGGRVVSLPEMVRLEEDISRVDGSTGWTVTLCSGAGWFAGFFPTGPVGQSVSPASEELTRLFSDPRLCIAGSGAATGEAHLVSGSYRISGRWAYASGSPHATAFTANCVIWKDGVPLLTDQGLPVIRPFLFRRNEVRVLSDWKAVGLVATASHGFEVTCADLPVERLFTIDPATADDPAPLYRYPFLQLAETTLAANLSGMGAHFLDCCAERFSTRGRGVPAGAATEMERLLEEAQGELEGSRATFYDILDSSWAVLGIIGEIEQQLLLRVSRASHALAGAVRKWVDTLYPYAGLGAARTDTEINRVWRDLHTAGQHPVLVFGGA